PAPSPRQRLFLTDGHPVVAYGGARGGGKSWAVRVKAVLLCLRWPGIKALIVRRSYPELQENHILPLCALLRVDDPDPARRLALYQEQRKQLVFPNGSRILFRCCDDDRDAQRFQGLEVDVLFVDEATQQPEERIQQLRACVRGANAFPKRVYLTCNPGGPGHGWVKRLFIDRRFREGEDPADYVFIPARATDNLALMAADPGYVARLRALPPKLREAWLYGRWDLFRGQFFQELRLTPDLEEARRRGFDESEEELRRQGRFTHTIAPLDLAAPERRGWTVFRSYDFGYGRPFSCGWWAVDHDGILYRILELYGCTEVPNEGLRWPPERQFREIARLEREHPWLRGRQISGVADPSIWDGSRGESVAETAARCGIWFTPGENARVPGWMQCHYRLQFDGEGRPRMYVFEGCSAFLRTVPELQFSKTVPEDLDTTQEDHVADEWRYACMSRPVAPLQRQEVPPRWKDPLAK
ncbi:MAG: phage terminase large subunit, partial [Oscillospiraceae bacterium]|nr:phage terminase large subunit [Oscillospiraceae bacterium]